MSAAKRLRVCSLFAISLFFVACVVEEGIDNVEIQETEQFLSTIEEVDASEDTFVDSANPSTAFGSQTTLFTDWVVAGFDEDFKHTWLKFDIPSFGTGHFILDAKLRLRTTSSGGGVSVAPEVYKFSNNSWDEDTLTWNNRPSGTSTFMDDLNGNSISDNSTIDYDVSSAIPVFSTGGITLTFVTIPQAINDAAIFHSKESSSTQIPQLILTVR